MCNFRNKNLKYRPCWAGRCLWHLVGDRIILTSSFDRGTVTGMEWKMFRIIDIQESPSINQFINQLYSPHIYIVYIFSCHVTTWGGRRSLQVLVNLSEEIPCVPCDLLISYDPLTPDPLWFPKSLCSAFSLNWYLQFIPYSTTPPPKKINK